MNEKSVTRSEIIEKLIGQVDQLNYGNDREIKALINEFKYQLKNEFNFSEEKPND